MIKYSRNQAGYLAFWGPIQCLTSDYRPLICTALDDNTVGAQVWGSTGVPSGYYAYIALEVSTGMILSHVRASYANYAISIYGGPVVVSRRK